MFFSALEDSFQTCCHPEFLLNKRYINAYTEDYAKLWDEIYSKIYSYFDNPDKCTEANNIIIKLDGSVSYELLKRAAEEMNARTSERMRELAERGEHPWQQPEFIKAHSKRTSERMKDLVARGEHWFQQPEFIEENSKRARALVDIGEHLFQQPEFIEETSERMRDLVAQGEHLFQQPEFIEENSKRARASADVGEHLFQQPEFINAHSERTSERMRDLVARGEHLFQQPEFIEETSKRARDLVARGEHLFQKPEFIEETSKREKDLVARGEHLFQKPEFIEKRKKVQEEQAGQKKEQEDQARHEALHRKKEHEEHALQQKKEQEGQAPKARGKIKSFDDQMEDLKRFKETHGHANVTIPEEKSLGHFCAKARYSRKNPGKGVKMTDERIAAFDALGFIWTSKEYVTRSFDERINDLEEYKQTHGHVNVKRNEDSSLYQFCAAVRHSLKQPEKDGTRKLTEERMAKLDALGFKWTH